MAGTHAPPSVLACVCLHAFRPAHRVQSSMSAISWALQWRTMSRTLVPSMSPTSPRKRLLTISACRHTLRSVGRLTGCAAAPFGPGCAAAAVLLSSPLAMLGGPRQRKVLPYWQLATLLHAPQKL